MTTKGSINTNGASALEQRIDAALSGPDTASSELLTLLDEVEASISEADEDAAAEREKALRLQSRLREIEKAEKAANWEADYEQVEAHCDELAREFAETYPRVVQQLVDLFQRMAKCDEEVSRVNISAPPGEHRRLRGPELTARDLKSFSAADPSIVTQVTLPDFEQSDKMAWPPPMVPLGVVFAQTMLVPAAPYANDRWWEAVEERERHKREAEVERAKYYAALTKAQEDRVNSEARANFEALRKRREGGPE